jgi:hypothetical protein
MSGRGCHSEEEDDGDIGVSSAEMPVTDPSTSPSSDISDDILTLPLLTSDNHNPSQIKVTDGSQSLSLTSHTPPYNLLIESSYMSPATYGGFRDPDFFEGFQESPGPDISSNKIHSLSQNIASIKSCIPKSNPESAKDFDSSGPPTVKNKVDQTATTSTAFSDNNPTSTVILIEPIADHRTVEKFFGNDILLSKSIESSLFGKIGVHEMNKNFKRKILIVTLKPGNENRVSELLNVNKLGNWNIRCRLPRAHTITYGVIGPFGPDVSDEELTEILTQSGYDGAKATRIFKTSKKIKTSMFKVMLEVSQLPHYIYLGYQRYPVKLYIDSPWQCFKCQKFGHTASDCHGKQKCVVCSGAHSLKDCTGNSPKCGNCGGAHTASYGGCAYMKEAKEVEKLRAECKLSYRDAVAKVKNVKSQRPVQVHPNSIITISNTNRTLGHSETLVNTKYNNISPIYVKHTIDASVQTEATGQSSENSSTHTNTSELKLIVLLWQVLKIQNTTNAEDQLDEIIKLAKNTVDIKVKKYDVIKYLDRVSNDQSQNEVADGDGDEGNNDKDVGNIEDDKGGRTGMNSGDVDGSTGKRTAYENTKPTASKGYIGKRPQNNEPIKSKKRGKPSSPNPNTSNKNKAKRDLASVNNGASGSEENSEKPSKIRNTGPGSVLNNNAKSSYRQTR